MSHTERKKSDRTDKFQKENEKRDNRTARTEQPKKGSQKRAIKIGLPGQESQDKMARQEGQQEHERHNIGQNNKARIGHVEHDNMTDRTVMKWKPRYGSQNKPGQASQNRTMQKWTGIKSFYRSIYPT
jgi:hypothetical protein